MMSAGVQRTTGGMTAANRLPSGSWACKSVLSSWSFLPSWFAITSRPVCSLPASHEMVFSWSIMPSRSYHQEASGLPMISLTLSSSKRDSIGRRNGKINSKLIAGASPRWKPSHLTGLPRVRMRALCGCFLLSRVIVILIFRSGLFGAIELEDRRDPDFPDALLRVRFLALVFAAAQLAFDLDMCALRERLGEL